LNLFLKIEERIVQMILKDVPQVKNEQKKIWGVTCARPQHAL
jgi:hypothetical protein